MSFYLNLGLGFSPGSVGALTSNILVANRGMIGIETSSYSTTTTCRIERWSHAAGSITDIKTVDVGFYYNSSFTNSGVTSSPQFKRYIEYPEGVFHQVTWSSAATFTMVAATTHISDIILSSVTGLPLIIPAGTKFWERTVLITSSAKAIANMLLPAFPTAIGVDDGKATGDFGNSGTIAAQGSGGQNRFCANMLFGTVNAANAKAACIFGDSITYGQGDETSTSTQGSSGYTPRGLDALGIPYVKFARGSQQMQHHVAMLANPTGSFQNMLTGTGKPFTDVILQAGLNDMQLGSRTAAQILADDQTVIANFTTQRKWRNTITPRTSSSNSYADAAGQTVLTTGTLSEMTTLNDGIRAASGFTGVLDIADRAMTARNSGIWGPPYPPTADGSHPNSAGAAYLAGGITI